MCRTGARVLNGTLLLDQNDSLMRRILFLLVVIETSSEQYSTYSLANGWVSDGFVPLIDEQCIEKGKELNSKKNVRIPFTFCYQTTLGCPLTFLEFSLTSEARTPERQIL